MGVGPIFASGALPRSIRRLRDDRKGAMLLTYALMLPTLLGVTAMGLETGIWYTAKRSMQTQADAAALSGAFERAKGNPDYQDVSASAEQEAERNGFANSGPNTMVVNNPPETGPNAGEQAAVEVVLRAPRPPLLASLFLGQVNIAARSVAMVEVTGTACVLALDPTASGAVHNQGNPSIDMQHCVIAANSTDSAAITLGGSADLTAESLWTAGNYTVSSSASMSLERPATVNAWPLDDPYADVTIPSLSGCDYDNVSYSNVTLTIDPGIYCDGINFGSNAHITLNPGTYYVSKGDINIAATAVLRCNCTSPGDGVTFVMTSNAGGGTIGTITINGGADVLLNAPTDDSDPFKGILFYQDRAAPPGPTVKFNGGSNMLLTGAIYFSNQNVSWSGGNGALGATCTQIIGRTVSFDGNSAIENTGCEAAGIIPLEIVGVRVVE